MKVKVLGCDLIDQADTGIAELVFLDWLYECMTCIRRNRKDDIIC